MANASSQNREPNFNKLLWDPDKNCTVIYIRILINNLITISNSRGMASESMNTGPIKDNNSLSLVSIIPPALRNLRPRSPEVVAHH